MLIDTSGWLCLYHRDEPQHQEAVKLFTSSVIRLTHNYILAEFVPLAHTRGFPRHKNLEFTAHILDAEDLKIVWVDENLHRRAVELIQNRQDKNYSLCDAVSFVVMREQEISESLTTDKHFEQEGFKRLLKP